MKIAIPDIAKVCHEVNRAYCLSLGDTSQPTWENAPEWQKTSAENGVQNILSGSVTTPEQSHQSWLHEKEQQGWSYGEVKDVAAKLHPCFVPYADLPPEQQVKDALFFAVVNALK